MRHYIKTAISFAGSGMTQVKFEGNNIEVDAHIIGEALGIDPARVQAGIREGTITSLCERGIDEDDGTYRLSFYTEHKRLRMIVDQTGAVVQRSTVTSADRPLSPNFRKPGI